MNTVKVTADQQTIDEIAKRSDVARVVPDSKFTLPPLQPNAGQINAVEWGIDNIHAPEAWEKFGARGEGIVVANIDTGVQFDHPALVHQYRGNLGGGGFDHNYNWFDPASVCGTRRGPVRQQRPRHAHHGHHGRRRRRGQPDRRRPRRQVDRGQGLRDQLLLGRRRCSAAGQWILAPTDLNGQNPDPICARTS